MAHTDSFSENEPEWTNIFSNTENERNQMGTN